MDEKVFMSEFEKELKNIEQICNSKEFQYQIEQMRAFLSGKPLILYGAGAVGGSAVKCFKHYGFDISCFCDKNKVGIHNDSGLPIISPQMLINKFPDANIVICSVNYKDEIEHDLASMGIKPENIYSGKFLNFHEMTYRDMEPHFGGYKRVFSLLNDGQSKQIMLERIKCYLTPFPIISCRIISLSKQKQYFDPELITLFKDEIFVDGGMYTGDTADIFFQLVGSDYAHYYGFEPDEKNFKIAEGKLKDRQNVTLVSRGLWSYETKLAFSGNLTSSSKFDLSEMNCIVGVTALDVFFHGKTPPTFIKMDIEGAEMEALKGAERIIRECKPKLAICAYHKPEDLYMLPELIKSYRNDYQFYLRHYTESIYETVLYAI